MSVSVDAQADKTTLLADAASAMAEQSFQHAVALVQSINAIPTMLDVICRTTSMGFAAVARVTESRWIACEVKDDISFGLTPGGELKIETTICNEIRDHRQAVVIDAVDLDDRYRNHHTPLLYGFKSYISMPIVLPNGEFFGTLCAIDPKPTLLNTPAVIGMFKLFAELISFHLDANRRLAISEAALLTEREASALREQFIAVLGHDLRNPLASIAAVGHMVQKTPVNDHARKLLGMMDQSVNRMSGLIDNAMDFARGRLGGGLTLNYRASDLVVVLNLVVAELRASFPDRIVETNFATTALVECDENRIAQLFSNLVANAIAYGSSDKPISIATTVEQEHFELSVANAGQAISPEAMVRLFKPFTRGEVRPNQQGLGLGLYIASEIAKAHQGSLSVTSDAEETRFVLRIPLSGSTSS